MSRGASGMSLRSSEPALSSPVVFLRRRGGGRKSKPAPAAIWNVPYLRNPNFTGRDALLDELHDEAHGRPGRAHRRAGHGRRRQDPARARIRLRSRRRLRSRLVAARRGAGDAARGLRRAGRAARHREGGRGRLAAVADAVRQALSRRNSWLLVFDNATGPDDVTGLLPRAGGGRVLITSRNPSWPSALPLDVPVLEPRRRDRVSARRRPDQDDRDAADAVAEELGDLPLALAQAAAYVSGDRGWSRRLCRSLPQPSTASCGPRKGPRGLSRDGRHDDGDRSAARRRSRWLSIC